VRENDGEDTFNQGTLYAYMAMSKIKQVIYVKLIYINKNVYVYTYI
jgi:hypothetical protein